MFQYNVKTTNIMAELKGRRNLTGGWNFHGGFETKTRFHLKNLKCKNTTNELFLNIKNNQNQNWCQKFYLKNELFPWQDALLDLL